MSLLLKEWKTFTENNKNADSTAMWNAKRIEQLAKAGNWRDWSEVYLKFSLEWDYNNIDQTEELEEVISKIEPMSNNKVVRLLGVGTQGVVFELDNGHALKLFRRGYLSYGNVEGEMNFYSSSKEKLFTKKGKLHTLPVYDYGKTDDGLYWVEMAKLVPLDHYAEMTGREDPTGLMTLIVEYLIEFEDMETDGDGYLHDDEEDRQDYENKRKRHMQSIKKQAEKAQLTLRELGSLIDTIKSVYDEYGESYVLDLHSGNMGVLETSTFRHGAAHDKKRIMDPTRTPRFVLFDP